MASEIGDKDGYGDDDRRSNYESVCDEKNSMTIAMDRWPYSSLLHSVPLRFQLTIKN